MSRIDEMIVGRIEDEGDRILIFASATPDQKWMNEYHVIAKRDVAIKPGDRIAYEPFGANFGWFVENLTRKT